MDKLNMIARLALLGACLLSTQSFAAGGAATEHANIDPGNIASLQRGARNFMNYCSGCHSAKYVRFSTIGKHLELSDEQLVDNLMFNAQKTFETIKVSMPAKDSARWFGKTPPDLSLMARAKGADYVYSFLKGFYVEEGSPTGVNNTVLAGTSMPHVLWELQGFNKANFVEHSETNAKGDTTTSVVFEGFEPLTEGSLSAEEYDEFVRDTVNFLSYIAEPMRAERRKLGVWVLIFLSIFLILAIALKKEFWRDVH
jgi:ubiquinol-cytochrome c reductase cytochrome c1 subunit